MTPTAMPLRKQILAIELISGVASQFEPTEDGYFFRRNGFGPAIRVTRAEHDMLAKAGNRALLLHIAAFAICGCAGWLAVARTMQGSSDHAVGAVVGIVVSLIGLAVYGSLRWHADAPARALSGRGAERPARDPDFGGYPGYGTIFGWTALLLFLVVVRPQPAVFNVVLTIFGVVFALFLAGRRWWFVNGLTSGQLAHAKQVKKLKHRRDNPEVSQISLGKAVLLMLFLLVEVVALWAGILVSVGIAAAIMGRTWLDIPFGPFMAAFLVGLALGGLFAWPVEWLCKRWTGESAYRNFEFPAGW